MVSISEPNLMCKVAFVSLSVCHAYRKLILLSIIIIIYSRILNKKIIQQIRGT